MMYNTGAYLFCSTIRRVIRSDTWEIITARNRTNTVEQLRELLDTEMGWRQAHSMISFRTKRT